MKLKAAIIDIDDTLAATQNAEFYADDSGNIQWDRWMESTMYAPVNEWCREIVNGLVMQGCKIIFLTSRMDKEHHRALTEKWLQMNGFVGYELLMRPDNDLRKDDVIKRETYTSKIAPTYDVLFAVDDKKSIVDMWRDIGIPALHCADY